MNIKFFHSNKNDRFEFTREELEKLLNDIYMEENITANEPLLESLKQTFVYNKKSDGSVYCTDTDSIGKIILEEIKGE